MELGEKLRQARLEAGLTQKQLCGEEITRNMLSLLENGSASPSIKTLQYLAGRLGKPMSYFLEETAVVSPNTEVMAQVRRLFDAGAWGEAARTLDAYREPDAVYDREKGLLQTLILLELARQAVEQGRSVLARELLGRIDPLPVYCARELDRRRLLLLGQLREPVAARLPSLDRELLLRAREAMEAGDSHRAACLLDAAEDTSLPEWNLLRGKLYLAAEAYAEAARCFHGAEASFPKETAPALERCYRELEDYKRAYEYACKQK